MKEIISIILGIVILGIFIYQFQDFQLRIDVKLHPERYSYKLAIVQNFINEDSIAYSKGEKTFYSELLKEKNECLKNKTPENLERLELIKQLLDNYNSFLISDYDGLTVINIPKNLFEELKKSEDILYFLYVNNAVIKIIKNDNKSLFNNARIMQNMLTICQANISKKYADKNIVNNATISDVKMHNILQKDSFFRSIDLRNSKDSKKLEKIFENIEKEVELERKNNIKKYKNNPEKASEFAISKFFETIASEFGGQFEINSYITGQNLFGADIQVEYNCKIKSIDDGNKTFWKSEIRYPELEKDQKRKDMVNSLIKETNTSGYTNLPEIP